MVSQGHALSRDELVRALVSHTGIATADGAVTNDSLIDSNLIGWDQRKIVEKTILISSGDSNLEDAAATVFNPVTGEITISPAFSNQILAGTVYRIINISTVELDVLHILTRIGTNVDPAGTTTLFAWLANIWAGLLGGQGLVYGGIVTAAVAGASFTIASLAGLGATKFASTTQPPYRAYVLREALGGIGGAPQGEMAAITGYVTATGLFTPNAPAFTVDIAVGDEVLILHPRIAEILDIYQETNQIFNLVNAMLTLTETGGTVVATGLLTEDDVYINNAPVGAFKPVLVKINMSDLAGGEVATVRTRYRIEAGGALELSEPPVIFAGVQAEPLKDVDLKPNRFGVQVTIEATAAVVFPWEVFSEV